jgi:hypothetical protein
MNEAANSSKPAGRAGTPTQFSTASSSALIISFANKEEDGRTKESIEHCERRIGKIVRMLNKFA